MSKVSTVGEIVGSDMEQSGALESDTGNHHLFRLGKSVSTGRNLTASDEIGCFKKLCAGKWKPWLIALVKSMHQRYWKRLAMHKSPAERKASS